MAAIARYRERIAVDFTGTWDVVSSPDFDDEYLKLGGGRSPYLALRQNGKFVKGEYEIGVMCGTINGGAHSDFVDFDFGGNDEMEVAFGEGQATLEGERLIHDQAMEDFLLKPFQVRLYVVHRGGRRSLTGSVLQPCPLIRTAAS
jgi:hypothetical protein